MLSNLTMGEKNERRYNIS